MDDTLKAVREKCALQLEMYQKCVENYPETWDQSCRQQKNALNKCSEDNVGIIKYVKTQCTPQINAYDRCLKENTEDPRVCIPVFKDLYICTEAASVTFKEQATKN
ncbi:unnamed protein product [Rhizopus stolonifer]